jgi:hypothetical protein
MGWLFGDKDAVEDHRAARRDLEDYERHYQETHPRDEWQTDEDLRLQARVRDTEQHVPWWRR